MTMSPEIGELAKALSKFQGEAISVVKNKTAQITAQRSYDYADITAVWNAIRKPLFANGLSVSQSFAENEGRVSFVTLLIHNSGQWIKSVLPMPRIYNKAQDQGTDITYMRRYALSSILGLCADDDDDAASADEADKVIQEHTKQAPSKAPAKAMAYESAEEKQLTISELSVMLKKDGVEPAYLKEYIEDRAREKKKSPQEMASILLNSKWYKELKKQYIAFLATQPSVFAA